MSGNAAIGDSNNTQSQNNINSTLIGNDSLNASAVESGGQGAEDIIESDTQISSQENITIGAVDGSNETSKDGKKPLSPVLIAILIVVWVLLLVGIGVLVFILIKKKKGLL